MSRLDHLNARTKEQGIEIHCSSDVSSSVKVIVLSVESIRISTVWKFFFLVKNTSIEL